MKYGELIINRNIVLLSTFDHLKLADIVENNVDFYIMTQGTEDYKIYDKAALLAYFSYYKEKNVSMESLPSLSYFTACSEGLVTERDYNIYEKEVLLIVDAKFVPIGVAEGYQNIGTICNYMKHSIQNLKLKAEFFKKVLDNFDGEITVNDGYGFINYFNPKAAELMGMNLEGGLWMNSKELVASGYISNSTVLEVLEKRRKITNLTYTKNAKTLYAMGWPIFDANNNIEYVISTSIDLDLVPEIDKMTKQILEMKQTLNAKNIEINALKEELIRPTDFIFESNEMKEVMKSLIKVAKTDITVLIEGDSGTGKEVIAQTIHQHSVRKDNPLIKINCAAIPKELLESELFGYVGGAFTGALKNGKIGKIQKANKSTLFLDEIGELPLEMQAKLLEFMQDKQITPVGSVEPIPVDVRVVAATNRNLAKMVENNAFRKDLFYRLNAMPIMLMPLSERKDDIIPMIVFFLKKYNEKYGTQKNISHEILYYMKDYTWPGNVRELKHIVESLVIMSEDDQIDMDLVNHVLKGNPNDTAVITCSQIMNLKEARDELYGILAQKAHEKYKNSYDAAKILGVDQSTVIRILKKSGYQNPNSKKISCTKT